MPHHDRSEQTPEETERLAGLNPMHRRALFASLLGGSTVLALIQRFGFGSTTENSTPALQQSASVPSLASPTSVNASPVASPLASPVPELSIGKLHVHRGETFTYKGKPSPSKLITLAVTGGADNLNFNPAAFRQSYQITSSYLDPLVWINDVTMEPEPWLASSWTWADDNRSITFKLRKDVRWHNGDKLTAKDVAFSLEVYRDDLDSGARNLFTQMDSAEAVDSYTLKVNLVRPDGNWLLNAASQLIFQRKQYVDHWTSRPVGQRTLSDFNWSSTNPVGTGPWVVGSRRSVRVEFARNEDYFSGAPNFETQHILLEDSTDDLIDRWNDGKTDVLWPISAGELDSVDDQPDDLYVSKGAQVMFAAFNFDNQLRSLPSLLADIRVRRALALTIDRQRILTETFRGLTRAYAAGTVAQPWAYEASLLSPKQDIGKAKKLFSDAGLSDLNNDGFLEDFNGGPLVFTAIVRDDSNPLLIQLLNDMTEDFMKLGTQLDVNVLSPEDFFMAWTQSREYDFIAYSYPLYPGFTDYDLYGSNYDIRINPQGWNPGGYANDDVDADIKQILLATDPEKQRELLVDLQNLVNGDLFGMWFGFPDDLVIARPEIQGYQPNKYLPTWNTRYLWRQS